MPTDKIQTAINCYKAFYRSCVTVPFNAEQNMNDYLLWQAAHDALNGYEQGYALGEYMRFAEEQWHFGDEE